MQTFRDRMPLKMSEKIFNHITHSGLCPHCKGDLHKYSVLKPKKLLGIKISEEYLDYFECSGCEREYSLYIVDKLLPGSSIKKTTANGTAYNYEFETVAKNVMEVRKTVNYQDTLLTFKDEDLFVTVFSKIVFILNREAGKTEIDLRRVPHLNAVYGEAIRQYLAKLKGMDTDALKRSACAGYEQFCKENHKQNSWYVLSQSARFIEIHHFIPNERQADFLKQLLTIFG